MHKYLIYLPIWFCLTCFGLSFNPSSGAGVQRGQWFKSPGYHVSARALIAYPGRNSWWHLSITDWRKLQFLLHIYDIPSVISPIFTSQPSGVSRSQKATDDRTFTYAGLHSLTSNIQHTSVLHYIWNININFYTSMTVIPEYDTWSATSSVHTHAATWFHQVLERRIY
jgi:hypothetical protein